MILIAGIPSEGPVRLAIEAAAAAGADHVVLNQRQMHVSELTVDLDSSGASGEIEVAGRRLALADIDGIYARIMDVGSLPEFRPRQRRSYEARLAFERACAFQAAFLDWVELAPCRVVSRPSDMTSNNSKPFQAALLERCGLTTPQTLITNDPAEVRAFASEHRRVVYKSISGTRSIVQTLDSRALTRLERVRALPTQFQAHVPGVDVRVHVAGRDVHATEIRSGAVDYRYAGRNGSDPVLTPHALPEHVAERCVAAAAALRLPLCGLDLRRTPAGEYVCFEANPMPAYSYYQLASGQPIAESLIGYLAGLEASTDGSNHRELVRDRG
jgi:glutathione synthase/RimK-type ligase-like ATP-grasp enzyme